MPSNVTGYDVSNTRNLERIADSLFGIHKELRRIADLMEASEIMAPEPAMEEPPDTSWVETEDVKRDYGRDTSTGR